MNVLVLYYSQSGQIREILNAMTKPLTEDGARVEFVQIDTDPSYPFPWTSEQFFSTFPDSKLGNDCTLKPLVIKNPEAIDLIILGLQVWYLEPSIPVASFMRSRYAEVLRGKPIITVYGVRNMWINAHHNMKTLIYNAGGRLVGNIVLQDRHNNLVSVLTIVRWLIKGKKEAGSILPHAGVTENEILACDRFGKIISEQKGSGYEKLQDAFIESKAFKVDYHIMKTEFAGTRIFGIWAKMIQKKSRPSEQKRKRLLVLFKYYLFFVIFVVSPISSFIFRIIRLLFRKRTQKEILKHTALVQ
jgi:hypothetical protein